MKKLFFSWLLLFSLSLFSPILSSPEPVSLDLTSLLDDARADGVEKEVIPLEEIGFAELWLRKLGGVAISGYLGAKYYTMQLWQAMGGEVANDDECE